MFFFTTQYCILCGISFTPVQQKCQYRHKNTQWTNNVPTKSTSWKNIPRVNISTHKNVFFYIHDDQTTAIIIIIAIIQQQQQQQQSSSIIIIIIIIIVLVIMEVHCLSTIVQQVVMLVIHHVEQIRSANPSRSIKVNNNLM